MMNYSDYDSDGYSSNEDADYVPSDDNLSEDDINECEKEDPLHEGDSVPHPDKVIKKKRKKNDLSMRKRKKGALRVDKEEKDDGGEEKVQPPQEEVDNLTEVQEDEEAKQKKKSDDLWASFLSDVGCRPKDPTPVSQSSTTQKNDSSVSKVAPLSSETKASEPAKVTITKVFDFAGEEVRVNKVVSADSKEAKSYLKCQDTQQEENGDEDESSSPTKPPLPGPSAKRPAGMSSILGRIGGKKQKMSTLEKSKMDWDAFKSEEGITEELAIHNRGREGYVERKNFLERVDHRQFELEKAVRQSNMKQ
ncbi:LOW QUALITY PROTEIN: craniofacial development protein 1 [Plectropomus leopardus]|uniref:LOW QUALITY PROTEIN: craniofacial development protein 1 n=1 Tax=Plectropomus leopardus TaxID=160734 RepID=UPI001C4B1CF5|nr:LOW QUALITY PROTEIN: craniofacial development protein 1 [Plectropomus leopardus]